MGRSGYTKHRIFYLGLTTSQITLFSTRPGDLNFDLWHWSLHSRWLTWPTKSWLKSPPQMIHPLESWQTGGVNFIPLTADGRLISWVLSSWLNNYKCIYWVNVSSDRARRLKWLATFACPRQRKKKKKKIGFSTNLGWFSLMKLTSQI